MSFKPIAVTQFVAGAFYEFFGVVARNRKSRTTGETIPSVRKFEYPDPDTGKPKKGVGVSLLTHEIVDGIKIPTTVDLAFYRNAAAKVNAMKLKTGARLKAIGQCRLQDGDRITFKRFDCDNPDWVSQPTGTDEL